MEARPNGGQLIATATIKAISARDEQGFFNAPFVRVGILSSDTEGIKVDLMAVGDHVLMNGGIRPLAVLF